jgi:hypothetical protein
VKFILPLLRKWSILLDGEELEKAVLITLELLLQLFIQPLAPCSHAIHLHPQGIGTAARATWAMVVRMLSA